METKASNIFKEVILIAIVYLAVSIPYIKYDSFSGDEIVPANIALNIVAENGDGRHATIFLNIFEKNLPVNSMSDYNFALPSYILLPLINSFGSSIFMVKFSAIMISFLYIIVLFFTILMLFNEQAALITIILLELSPLFIYNAKIGFDSTEPIINLFFTTGILLVLLYKKFGYNVLIFLAFLFFGSCLSVKISALSRYIGVLAGILIIYRKETFTFVKGFSLQRLLLAIGCFCIGAYLFICYNLVTAGKTLGLVRYLYSNEQTITGESNSEIIKHFLERIAQFQFLAADKLPNLSLNETLIPALLLFSFLIMLLGVVFFSFITEEPFSRKKIYIVYIFFISMFLTSLFSPGSWQPNHLTILYPFPQLLTAIFIVIVLKLKNNFFIRHIAIVLFVIVIIGKGLLMCDYQLNNALLSNNTYNNDERIHRLCEYIEHNSIAPCFFVDFATNEGVYFLSNARITGFHEGFSFNDPDSTYQFLKRYLKPPENLYVIRTLKNNSEKHEQGWESTMRYLNSQNIKITLVKEINDKNGIDALFMIYSIK